MTDSSPVTAVDTTDPTRPHADPSGSTTAPDHLGGLDALRGLAVGLVVILHAASLAGRGNAGALATPAAVGDVGVAIFFVLSGFLIYRPYAIAHAGGAPTRPAGEFWWRRVVRIFPAYWVAVVVFLLVGVNHVHGAVDLLAHLTVTHVYRPASLFNGLTQAWSLAVEVTFYLCVPLWSRLVRRASRGSVTLLGELAGLTVLILAAHAWRVLMYHVSWTVGGVPLRGIGFSWMPTQMDLLAAGMALAVVSAAVAERGLAASRLRMVLRSAWIWWQAGLVLVIVYAYTIGAPTIAEGYSLGGLELRQLVYLAVGVAMVAPFMLAEPQVGRFRRAVSGRAAWWVGTLSYGVYLWHNDWMEWFAGRGTSVSHNVVVLLVIGFGTGIAFALASWFVIERPAQRLRGLVSSGRSIVGNWSERSRDRVGAAVVAVTLLAPLWGLLRYQGPPMEEGFMLAFPDQLLHGRLPHRDFLHLYGPGSLWVLAGLYKFFGETLTVERLTGFAQHAAVAFALLALLRPWGRRVAVTGAVAAVAILITPLGLSAMAWNGALAFALVGLAVALRPEASPRMMLAAGMCGGAALLYRPDLVIAITLSFGVVAWFAERSHRRNLLAGLGGTLALYVVHFATSGFGASFEGMFLQPVFRLRGGRSLPIPPSWSEADGFLQRVGGLRTTGWPLPMFFYPHQIVLWFWAVLAVTVFLAYAAWRSYRRRSPHHRTLVPLCLFGAALVTQALQRPDTAHLSWVSGVTFPIAGAAIAELLRVRSQRDERAIADLHRVRWATAPVVVMLLLVIPFYPVRTYSDLVGQTFGHHRFGYEMHRGDRSFYYGDRRAADNAQVVIDELARRSHPGEPLIVGPFDLSKTPYSDAFLYYVFPELPAGTRYIEMDPGVADARGSGLAQELRQSTWLIQSNAWGAWSEANDSRFAGSDEPNRVVAQHYCLVKDADLFRLLERCR